MIDYSLWEFIENEKAQRRLELKARSTLLMGIPNEHQLNFNSIKDAKSLLQAVEKVLLSSVLTLPSPTNIHKLTIGGLANKFYLEDLEEMDIRWQIAMLIMQGTESLKKHIRKFSVNGLQGTTKTGMKENNKMGVPSETTTSNALVSCDGSGNFMPPKPDMSFIFSGLDSFDNEPISFNKPLLRKSEAKSSEAKLKQGVNTVKDKNVNTAKPKAVVNAAKDRKSIGLMQVKGNNCIITLKKVDMLMHKQSKSVMLSVPKKTDFLIYVRTMNKIDGDMLPLSVTPKKRENHRTCLSPSHFPYPKRRLTMEEIVNKFIEEGKREHEKMNAFIREFRTTNELLLKERNNSLSELKFEIHGLSRVMNKAQMVGSEDVLIKIDKYVLPIDFVILDMREDSRIPIILGRPFLATARATIDVFNKKITLRVGSEEVIFDADQSMKKPRTEDDECYGIEDLDAVLQSTAQERLENDNLEDDINQPDFKNFGPNSEIPIRRIDHINTPYSQETQEQEEMLSEHLYSASAVEIDKKKPELKDLPSHLV
ncbi:splicing factor [Tanacetum coccineum]